jgi:L-asparaginase II
VANDPNFTAGATVSPYRLLQDSSGNVIHATAATQVVLAASGASGADSTENIACKLPGQRVKLTASASIAKHARIMATTAGKIVTFSSGAGVFCAGYALEAADADGDVIECFFFPGYNAEDA